METPMGAGLDGRLYTDLSVIPPDNPAIPNEKFYLRTRASELLEDRKPWAIKVGGLLQQASGNQHGGVTEDVEARRFAFDGVFRQCAFRALRNAQRCRLGGRAECLKFSTQ